MRGSGSSCVLLVSLAATSVVVGQAYVQQGNVLDANSRIDSGGLNRSVPGYRPGMSNHIVTGNVTGGASFRGFSPVRDPSALFAIGPAVNATAGQTITGLGFTVPGQPSTFLRSTSPLPTDRLSNFNRDSYNVHDYTRSDDRRVYRPYFSSGSTVTNVRSILAGLNRPGTSQLKSSYSVPDPGPVSETPDPLTPDRSSPSGSVLGVPNYVTRGTDSVSASQGGALLSSTLMRHGRVLTVPAPELAAGAKPNEALRPVDVKPLDWRVSRFEPMDVRVQPGGDVTRVAEGGMVAGAGVAPGIAPPGEMRGEGATIAGAPDVYSAMVRERAGGLARPLGGVAGPEEGEPGSAMLKGQSTVARPAPRVEGQLPGKAEQPVMAPSQIRPADVPRQSLKTFVGTEQSQLNDYLREAEALLHAGRYYQAAGRYDLARTVAPGNPLPPLGRSMALLAAGEYLTSATNLFSAIRLFDSLALYDLDMKAFIPDLTMLDRRRADLEQRLERHEFYKLRFLLGYAEYCSGLERLGIANLEKAVAEAPEDMSYLRKFVDALRARQPDLTRPIDVNPGS